MIKRCRQGGGVHAWRRYAPWREMQQHGPCRRTPHDACLCLVVKQLAVARADVDPLRWQTAGSGWRGEQVGCEPAWWRRGREEKQQGRLAGAERRPGDVVSAHGASQGAHTFEVQQQSDCCLQKPCHAGRPSAPQKCNQQRSGFAHRTSLSGARPILVGCPAARTMSDEPLASALYALAPAESAHSRKTVMAPLLHCAARASGEAVRRCPCRRAGARRALPLR